MNDRNRWITFVNDFVVRWGAFLPAPRGDIHGLVQFGAAAVDAGARHAVYRVVRLPAAQPYEASREPYGDYLQRQARDRGRVPLFPQDTRPGPELSTPARLAFYQGDEIVEQEIEDVGALLRKLRPDRIETCRMFMRSTAPVILLGQSIPEDHTHEVRVEVRLDTDIWFPWIMGMLEDVPEDEEKPSTYDNRELADQHTPRLNAFLSELRQVTLDLGGRWERLDVDGVAVNYVDQWDDAGIRL